jgi:hypothetical protein
MKKLFALLLSLGTLSSVFAQRHNEPGWPTSNKSKETYNSRDYSYSIRERDAQVQKINRDFNLQIHAVRKDRRLRGYEKDRRISMLERQRDQQIKQVYDRFSNQRGRDYDNRSVYNDRKW